METRVKKENIDITYISDYILGAKEAIQEKIYEKEMKLREKGEYDPKQFQKEKEDFLRKNSLEEISQLYENIQNLARVSEQKTDLREVKSILGKLNNKAISNILSKEFKRIYKEEESINKEIKGVMGKELKVAPSKVAMYQDGEYYIIKDSSKPLYMSQEDLKGICNSAIANIQDSYLTKVGELNKQNIGKKEEEFESNYAAKELEEIDVIKKYLGLEIPIELEKEIRAQSPGKMQKYRRVRTGVKRELKALENLYTKLEGSVGKSYEIKKALKELEGKEGIISEKGFVKIREQLNRQLEKEQQRREKISRKIEIKRGKTNVAKSFSSVSRYKKMLELHEMSSHYKVDKKELDKVLTEEIKNAEQKVEKAYENGEFIPKETIYVPQNGDVVPLRDENGTEIEKGGYYSNSREIRKAEEWQTKTQESKTNLTRLAERGELAEKELEKMLRYDLDFVTNDDKEHQMLPVTNDAEEHQVLPKDSFKEDLASQVEAPNMGKGSKNIEDESPDIGNRTPGKDIKSRF